MFVYLLIPLSEITVFLAIFFRVKNGIANFLYKNSTKHFVSLVVLSNLSLIVLICKVNVK